MNKELQYRLTLKDFFSKKLGAAASQTKKLDDQVNKLKKDADSASSSFGQIGKVLGGLFVGREILSFGGRILDATMETQRFNTAINATAFNEAEARTNLRFLNNEVDELGLNLQAARAGYKTFSGAVMGTRLQGQKANKVFKQVAGATAVMGLTADQQEGAFLALGQMISKGTVQAEELRGQLGERIPGAFQIAARAMKMTTAQLGDAMEKGLIESTDFVTRFGDELERTFGEKLESATHSVQANVNRMSNEWERLLSNFGQTKTGLVNGFAELAAGFLKSINKVMETTNEMSLAFQKFGAKDFTFIQQKGSMLSGLVPFLKSNVRETEKFYEWLQMTTVKPSENDMVSALGSKSALLSLRSETSKKFARKEISDIQYKREYALISQALEDVTGNIEALKNAASRPLATEAVNKSKTDSSSATGVKSATEVYGARPQNINITLDRLGDVTINATNITEGAAQTREIFSKQLLEVLNDANLIASR